MTVQAAPSSLERELEYRKKLTAIANQINAAAEEVCDDKCHPLPPCNTIVRILMREQGIGLPLIMTRRVSEPSERAT